ncbi:hypothetical protein B0H11DRAFT_2070465 [Mycena galericulata]|nr:hypothetical protein B0H11DRAFT_2070465 [Mycena galericulata]
MREAESTPQPCEPVWGVAIGVWRTWSEGSQVNRHEVGKKSRRRVDRYELDRDASRGRVGVDGREGSPDTESSRIRRPFGRTGAISRYDTKPRSRREARAYCFWSRKSRSDGASAAYIPTSANNGARGHCSNPTGRRTIRSLPSSPIDMPMIALWIQIHGGRAGLIAQRVDMIQ